MQYKLVALDLDGTMLDNNGELVEENIRTVIKLKNLGVQFIIVTGRPDQMTNEYIEKMGIDAPVISSNGALIRDVATKEILQIHSFSKETVLAIYNYFKTKNLYPRFYTLDNAYSFNPNEFDESLNPFAKFSIRLLNYMPFSILGSIDELLNKNEPIIKLMFPANDVDELTKVCEDLSHIDNVEAVKATPTSIDIMLSGVTKAKSLLQYANTLGIKSKEIIAIGDGENDIQMLKAVGLGIAMGNATDLVKEYANEVALSNEEAGVSHILKKIFNIN